MSPSIPSLAGDGEIAPLSWLFSLIAPIMFGAIGDGEGASMDFGDGGDAPPSEPQPVTFDEDALIQPKGFDKPVKWSEFVSSRVDKSEFDRERQAWETRRRQAEQLLTQRAQQIDQSRQQPAPGAQPTDPVQAALSQVKGRPFVDGNTVNSIVEAVAQNNLQPLYQWANAVNQYVAKNEQQRQSLESRLTPFEQERQSGQLNTVIESAIKQAKVDLEHDGLKEVAPVLRQVAEDFYYGWEPGQGETREQYDAAFANRFTEHLDKLRRAIRVFDSVSAEEQRRARIPRRGGTATPTGDRPYKFETPRDIARRFHPPVGAAT